MQAYYFFCFTSYITTHRLIAVYGRRAVQRRRPAACLFSPSACAHAAHKVACVAGNGLFRVPAMACSLFCALFMRAGALARAQGSGAAVA